jgi:uncharacterized protein
MMQVAFQKNAKDFLGQCGEWLGKSEAEHNLILALCQTAQRHPKKGLDIRFSTLLEDDDCVVAAVQTPPRNLILSKATKPEIEKLAETMANQNFKFPGIVGPSDVSAAFANKWTQLTGQKSVGYMDQIIYTLDHVLMPPPIEGELRLAKGSETDMIAEWILAFSKDALPKGEQFTVEDAKNKAAEVVSEKRAYLWTVKGKPVAQASVSGTDAVARINMVYTPPAHRGHGYASAVVAHLSQLQLDTGKKMCCLYADARNPVSNSIYRKIGYEFAGRSSLYVLDKTS